MRPRQIALLSLLVLPSCLVQLVSFDVPPVVRQGRLFEVVVTGTATVESGTEDAAAVLQLPGGFVLVSAGSNQGVTVKRDDPRLMALYRAETGHYLAGFSGANSTGGSNPAVLRVLVQAPAALGSHRLKVALAGVRQGQFVAQDPAGVTDFALITAPTHSKPVVVQDVPGADFAIHVTGLPTYSSSGWGGVGFGDVDRDGDEDLAAIARLGDGPHVYLTDGQGSWLDSSAGLRGSSGRSHVAFGHFNRDGLLDLGDGNGNAFLGNGGSAWTRSNTGIVIRGGGMEGVAVGDANADGLDDVAFSGHFSGFVQVFLSNGAGGWTEASAGLPNLTQGNIDGGHKLLLRDVTGDGKPDVVWTRYYKPNVWAGDGQGNWTAGTGLGLHQFWGAAAGDLDGDGGLELVFTVFDLGNGQGGGGIQVYKRSGPNAWTLVPGTGLPASGMLQGLALADFDRDGRLDLVHGGYGNNIGLSAYRGAGNGTFTPWTGIGLPASGLTNVEDLAAGDWNGDSFPDLAAAVYGLGLLVYRNERTGFSLHGAGCRGTLAAEPRIGSTGGAPRIGNAGFTWTVGSGPAMAQAAFWIGAQRTDQDLGPIGAPGCKLHTPLLVAFPTALDASGNGRLPMPVPNVPALYQGTVFGQWGIVAPGTNALGAVFTGGGAARVGL
jgi:hypothetical protein